MFSVNQLLELNNQPTVLNALVDAYFEGKKAVLKIRMRDMMEAILDDVFEELTQQLEEGLTQGTEEGVADGGDAVEGAAHDDGGQQLMNTVPASTPAYVQSISREAIASTKNPAQSKEDISTGGVLVAKASSGKRPIKEEEEDSEDEAEAEAPVSKKARKMKAKKEVKQEEKEVEEKVLKQEKETLGDDGRTASTSSSITTRSKVGSKQTSSASTSSSSPSDSQFKAVCPEPGCGKQFKQRFRLKQHALTHGTVKQFACAYSPDGCTYESVTKFAALRHIRNVHLKKAAQNAADENSGEDEEKEDEEEEALKYLTIKQLD